MDLNVPKFKSDNFATIDADGIGMVWDLNELTVLTKIVNMKNKNNKIQGTAIVLDRNYEIISGWSDGFILVHQT